MSANAEDKLIAAGYRQAKAVCRQHARSFYFASAVLFGRRRRAAFAVYAVCRTLDDLVDEHGATQLQLQNAAEAVDGLFDGRAPSASSPFTPELSAAFREVVQHFGLRREPFVELLRGLAMDIHPRRYATWEELEVYCYRVAGTVGEMMAPILGCTDSRAIAHAVALGKAMQLTNILRDIREDFLRGRVYLPQDELRRFGVSESQLAQGRTDEGLIAFMRYQIARARALYTDGERGFSALAHWGGRTCARVMSAVYGGILGVIEHSRYDVFSRRARVSFLGKLALASRALTHQGGA